MDKKWDAIVVGTGIGGLTAGLYLARKGRSVLLLEAGKQFGGMLNPFARKKYHFDVGLHYVGEAGEGQTMRYLLDKLGLEDIRFREINPDCIDRYVFDGYENQLVKGRDRWGENLAADFPHEQDNIWRFIDLMKQSDDLMRLVSGRGRLGQVPGTLRHAGALFRMLRAPFSEVLAHYFDDPMLRATFAGPGGDIGLPPSKAGALVSIMVLNHFLQGGYYPIGGSGAMRDAYVAQLQTHGAELKRNQLVERIEALGGGGFAVTTAKGLRFEANTVVSNVDATHTVEMLHGAKPSYLVRRKVKKLRPSLGCFCLFIGTDLDVAKAGITDSNIWHYGDHDIDAGYAPAFEDRFTDNPFFFLTAPTLKDPETKRAPEDHHTLELITFVPSAPFRPWFDKPTMKRGPAYEALKAEVADRLLDSAEQYVPGIREHTLVKEAATPATVWHFVRGRDGGIYGPDHGPDQTVPRRIPTDIGVPGLYLAGASIYGAGILTCLVSGFFAGRQTEQHLRSKRSNVFSGARSVFGARA
jgi:phytoene dehydrogenase-like protein